MRDTFLWGSRIIPKGSESTSVIIDVRIVKRGWITLNVARSDDAAQKVSGWLQSSLLFAPRILPALAALSLDVVLAR